MKSSIWLSIWIAGAGLITSGQTFAQTVCTLNTGGGSCSPSSTVAGSVTISADSGDEIYVDNNDTGANTTYSWSTSGLSGSHSLEECWQVDNPVTTCTEVWVPDYVWVNDYVCDEYDSYGNCIDYVNDGYWENDGYYQQQCTTTDNYTTSCSPVVTVTIASSPPPAPTGSVCQAGTYSFVANGNVPMTMSIPSVSSTGAFTGTLTYSGVNYPITNGNCLNGSVSFTATGSGFTNQYSGNFTSSGAWGGSYSYSGGGTYAWSAQLGASAPPPPPPPPTTSGPCTSGSYSFVANGNVQMTMNIPSVSSGGAFTGTITYSGVNYPVTSGSCTNGNVTFTATGSGFTNHYTGTYTSSGAWSGTYAYSGGGNYVWSAQLTGPPTSTPPPASGPCTAGSYSFLANGNVPMTMSIPSVSSTGAFTGTITYSGVNYPVTSGSCTNGNVTFTATGSGFTNHYTGTYTSSGAWSGSYAYSGGGTYSWSAQLTSSPSAGLCQAGSYSFLANGNVPMTMSIPSVSSSGAFTGTITYSGVNYPVTSGSCTNGNVTFTATGSGFTNHYTGTYTSSGAWSGTYVYSGGGTYPWSAQFN